jgi:p-hydroxybenzoate 3-monooxygenase
MKVAVGIIGAGPAGLLVAHALARAAIECVVFERLPEAAVRARTRAGLIEARTAALLERHGLAQGLLGAGSTSGTCEFRRGGRRHVLDYARLAGARHRVYPQQWLVADLIDALRSAGGDIRYACPAQDVVIAEHPEIRLDDGTSVRCDFVLGCDGFHGITRAAMKDVACAGVDFGAEWLALLAESPPANDHTVYGLHPDGFAGQMLRSAAVVALLPAGRAGHAARRLDR